MQPPVVRGKVASGVWGQRTFAFSVCCEDLVHPGRFLHFEKCFIVTLRVCVCGGGIVYGSARVEKNAGGP
jgi:hypothetical protein